MFFFSSRRRHTRLTCDWSSDVCSSDLIQRSKVQGRVSRAKGEHEFAVTLMKGNAIADVCTTGEIRPISHGCLKRSEERRVGKRVDLECWLIIKKKKQVTVT